MRIKGITLLSICILFTSISFGQSDSILIKGKLIDSYSKKAAPNIEVILYVGYGVNTIITTTNESGEFEIKSIKENAYSINLNHDEYIHKRLYIKDDSETIKLKINIRPKNNSFTYLDVKENLLSKKVKSVFKAFSLQFDDIHVIYEPPFIARGFRFELGDSTLVFIFIDRIGGISNNGEKKLPKQKIIGIGISRVDGTITSAGEGRPYIVRMGNPYFVEEEDE